MNSRDLYSKLHQLGVNIGKNAIRKYTSQYDLAPTPKVSYDGEGRGRKSEYEDKALEYLYAAYKLLNGPIRTSLTNLQTIKPYAEELRANNTIPISDSILRQVGIRANDFAYLIELWINYCEEAKPKYIKYRVNICFEDKKMFLVLIVLRATRTRSRLLKELNGDQIPYKTDFSLIEEE